MFKRILLIVTILVLASPLLASDGSQPDKDKEKTAQHKPIDQALPFIAIATGFGLAFAAAFGALGQGRAIAASVEAMARQPEAAGRIFTSMIIGLALIESLVIYSLLISLLLVGKLG